MMPLRPFFTSILLTGVTGCAGSQCPPPDEPERIEVQPRTESFGPDGVRACDLDGEALALYLTASCVVNGHKRIVVTDLGDTKVLFDSGTAKPPLEIPNIPNKGFVLVRVPVARLLEVDRHLLLQLSGTCQGRKASGAHECYVEAP